MARFGKDTPGPDGFPTSDNRAVLSRFDLTEAAELTSLSVYFNSGSGGFLKGLIYADSSGTPGELVAVGAPSAASPTIPGWVQSDFSGQEIPAGTYWLGFVTSGLYAQTSMVSSGGAGAVYQSSHSYATPPDPWPGNQGALATSAGSIYVEYEPAGAPAPGAISGQATVVISAVGFLDGTGEVSISGAARMDFSAQAAPTMPAFGQMFPGVGGTWPASTGRVIASSFELGESANTLRFVQHFGGGGGSMSPNVQWAGLIYADDAGEPGELLAVSDTGLTGSEAGWYSEDITAELTPGTYWLATMVDGFGVSINSTIVAEGGTAGNIRRGEGMGTPSAPADPWPGSAATADGNLTAYVTYATVAPAGELVGTAAFSFAGAASIGAAVERLPVAFAQTSVYAGLTATTANMRDGDFETGGATDLEPNEENTQWIRADLGSPQQVTRVTVAGGTLPGWGGVEYYLNDRVIRYSNTLDDPVWMWPAAGTVAGATDSSPYETDVVLDAPITARYWAVYWPFYIATTEFRLYDDSAPPPGGISGTTTVAFTATGALSARAQVSGAATLAFAPTGTVTGRVSLDGTTDVVFAPAGAVTARGALTGTTDVVFAPAGVLTGNTDLSGTTGIVFTTVGTSTEPSGVSGTTTLSFAATATLSGRVAASGAMTVTFTAVASAAAHGALAGSTALSFTTAGAATVSGALTGATDVAFTPAGTLTGRADLSGATGIEFAASATTTPSGDLAGTTGIAFATAAATTGRTALAGATTLSFTPVATPSTSVGISGTAPLAFSTTATGVARAGVSGATVLTLAASAALSARGRLVGAATVEFSAAATPRAAGALAGAATISFSASASPQADHPVEGSTSIAFAATGTGTARTAISGATTVAFATAATASARATGSGTASIAFTTIGTAAGVTTLTGATRLAFECWLYTTDAFACPPERVALAPYPERLQVLLPDDRATIALSGESGGTVALGTERLSVVKTCG